MSLEDLSLLLTTTAYAMFGYYIFDGFLSIIFARCWRPDWREYCKNLYK